MDTSRYSFLKGRRKPRNHKSIKGDRSRQWMYDQIHKVILFNLIPRCVLNLTKGHLKYAHAAYSILPSAYWKKHWTLNMDGFNLLCAPWQTSQLRERLSPFERLRVEYGFFDSLNVAFCLPGQENYSTNRRKSRWNKSGTAWLIAWFEGNGPNQSSVFLRESDC